MKKRILPLVVIFILYQNRIESQNRVHFAHQSQYNQATDPPNTYNNAFAGAGACISCHNSQVNAKGASVAIVNDWRSSMMASSAKDPFWQAKVSHEKLVNPHLANEIETVCTRCHASMGNVEALNNGATHYGLDQMRADALAMDGASCTVCHQITAASIGRISGDFLIGNKEIYGPYLAPFGNPMFNSTGYTPKYGEQVKKSLMCASCLTLITHPLDLNGVPTGGEFVEQSPNQEWANSIYPRENTTCVSCHLPEIKDVVKITSTPPFVDGRTPYGMHHLAGGNVFMLKLINANSTALGVTANSTQFDSTLSRTISNLELKTLQLSVHTLTRSLDTLYFDVHLQNLAGHKIPSSYPSRRIFVEVLATNELGDTVFHSGKMDADYNLTGEAATYEPHYNTISNADEVQIYEMVMGDVNGDVTTVLERAAIHLKDNRIPPKGFTTTHPSYDTTKIAGKALLDVDFNKQLATEGSGADAIHYHIPLHGNREVLNIEARVYYQTVSNKWLAEMFANSSDEINRFKAMYTDADKQPVMLQRKSATSVFTQVDDIDESAFTIFPNPSHGSFSIAGNSILKSVEIHSASGQLMHKEMFTTGTQISNPIAFKNEKGVYVVSVELNDRTVCKKLILN